jgi:hypothetical protein
MCAYIKVTCIYCMLVVECKVLVSVHIPVAESAHAVTALPLNVCARVCNYAPMYVFVCVCVCMYGCACV